MRKTIHGRNCFQIAILFGAVLGATTVSMNAASAGIEIVSSHAQLEAACRWAKAKALSYVQTGKSGPLDGSERGPGAGNVAYIPCYWAGYPFRTAFYSRDFCHQAAGAHLLGLDLENLTMAQAFAGTATEGRRWYPVWALNFDGSIYKLDYRNERSFVREVPAVFELVEQGYRQYLWTANPAYLTNAVLWGFYDRAVTDFILLHDTRRTNGVAEGDGSGDIFRGCATYNEMRSPLLEAGDGIACQYQALNAYAELCAYKGDPARAQRFRDQAARLQTYFNTAWGVTPESELYVRGYDVAGRALTDFGRENSWFMPMKSITEPGNKTDAYLDFIAAAVETPAGRPGNPEAISYLPDVFFPYHRVDAAWRWIKYLTSLSDKEYPELSFVLLDHVVEGLLGFTPDAPADTFSTAPGLPKEVETMEAKSIPLGTHRLTVKQEGNAKTTVTHSAGNRPLTWRALFYGEHQTALVDGKPTPTRRETRHGVPVWGVEIVLPVNATVVVAAQPR